MKNVEQKGCKKIPKFYRTTTVPGGRPSKKARTNTNLSGLRNHAKPSPSPSDHSNHPTPPISQAPSPDRSDDDDSDMMTILSSWSTLTHWKRTINSDPHFRGQPQSMTTASGEGGFDVSRLRAKCSPCPIESQNCCMAWLHSQQEDFINEETMLETLIKEKGHLCLFLPKFHCELKPIEMVSSDPVNFITMLIYKSKYWGWCKYR